MPMDDGYILEWLIPRHSYHKVSPFRYIHLHSMSWQDDPQSHDDMYNKDNKFDNIYILSRQCHTLYDNVDSGVANPIVFLSFHISEQALSIVFFILCYFFISRHTTCLLFDVFFFV